MNDKYQKILDDIKQSGFPSELRTAEIFRQRNWEVAGNTYYIDFDEQKGREIDLVARYVTQFTKKKPEIVVVSTIYAEIKKSTKPWIVFSSHKSRIEERLAFPLAFRHNFNELPLKHRSFLNYQHPTLSNERYGRTGYIAFTQSNSTFFGAAVSAVKACIEAYRNAEEKEGVYSDDSVDVFLYTPLIVVDGELYECFPTGNSDELVLNEIEAIPYKFHYASPNYEEKSYYVDVVPQQKLEQYVINHELWNDHIFRELYMTSHHSDLDLIEI